MDTAAAQPFLYTPVAVPTLNNSPSPYNDYAQEDSGRPIRPGKSTTRSALLRPSFYWAAIIIVGQLFFIFSAWIFFAVTTGDREVVLSDSAAKYVLRNPKQVTFTVTLLSTVISYIVGFLWTRAVCYAISMALSVPVSLFAISTSITVSSGAPLWNIIRPTWTIAATITAIAFTAQSAGWATLLTPQIVQRDTRISGFELDFSNLAVHQLLLERDGSVDNAVTPELFTSIIPSLTASGVALATAKDGRPSLLNFNHFTFLNSTGGILPSSIVELPSELAPSDTLPASAVRAADINSPDGFNTNYTIIQQGFTANISCEKRDLNLDTIPPLVSSLTNQTLFNVPYFDLTITIQCPGANTTIFESQFMQNGNGGTSTIMSLICPDEATGAYDIIVVGTGYYRFIDTRVCHVQPQTSTVEVRYSGSNDLFNGTSAPSFITVLPPRNVTNLPYPGGSRMVTMLPTLMRLGQLYDGNTIGDSLSIFLDFKSPEQEINTILEAYLRGMMEFGGTIFRAALTQTNNAFYDNGSSVIPENTRSLFSGTYVAQTMGWHQDRGNVPGVLLAPTFITIVSIIIVIVAVYKTKAHPLVDQQDYFDATNILHVTAAATSGGMPAGTFPPFDDDGNRHALRTKVRMVTIPGGDGRIGFMPTQRGPDSEKWAHSAMP